MMKNNIKQNLSEKIPLVITFPNKMKPNVKPNVKPIVKPNVKPLHIIIHKPKPIKLEFAPIQLLPNELLYHILNFINPIMYNMYNTNNINSLISIAIVLPKILPEILKILRENYSYHIPLCMSKIILTERIINIKPLIEYYGIHKWINYCSNNPDKIFNSSKGCMFMYYLLNDYDKPKNPNNMYKHNRVLESYINSLAYEQLSNISKYIEIPFLDTKIFNIISKIFYKSYKCDIKNFSIDERSHIINCIINCIKVKQNIKYYINYHKIISGALENNYTEIIKNVVSHYVFKNMIEFPNCTSPYCDTIIKNIGLFIIENYNLLHKNKNAIDLYLNLIINKIGYINAILPMIVICLDKYDSDPNECNKYNDIIIYLLSLVKTKLSTEDISKHILLDSFFSSSNFDILILKYNIIRFLDISVINSIINNFYVALKSDIYIRYIKLIKSIDINSIEDKYVLEYTYHILVNKKKTFCECKYHIHNIDLLEDNHRDKYKDDKTYKNYLQKTILKICNNIEQHIDIINHMILRTSYFSQITGLEDRIIYINDILKYCCNNLYIINNHEKLNKEVFNKLDEFENSIIDNHTIYANQLKDTIAKCRQVFIKYYADVNVDANIINNIDYDVEILGNDD